MTQMTLRDIHPDYYANLGSARDPRTGYTTLPAGTDVVEVESPTEEVRALVAEIKPSRPGWGPFTIVEHLEGRGFNFPRAQVFGAIAGW